MNYKILIKLCKVLIISCLTTTSYTQTIRQFAHWEQLFLRFKLAEKWSFNFQLDNRRFVPDRQWQSLTQTHVHYRFHKNVEAVLGFNFVYVWTNTGKDSFSVPELRPFQEFQFFQPLGKGWQLSQRVRLENRIVHNYNAYGLTSGYKPIRFRPRLRLQLQKTIDAYWTARLSEEFSWHTDNGFNQSQTWLIVERKLKKGFAVDLGYMKNYVRQITTSNEYWIDRDNLRFSVIKNFDLIKKKT